MDRRHFVTSLFAGAGCSLLSRWGWTESKRPSLVVGQYGKLPAPSSIGRIVSAGPVADVLLVSLAPEKLLGISTHSLADEAKKYLPTPVRELPNTGRIAGRGTTFPLEKLIALKPDIVVDSGSTDDTYLSSAKRVAEQTGIPYIVVDGNLAKSAQQLRELGEILGVAEKGNQLADCAQEILSTGLKAREEMSCQPQVRVFFACSADGMETGLSGSIHTEVFDFLGVHNVASAAGKNLSARVSMEQLIQWNPEVIVTMDVNYYQRLQSDAIWQRISAVKNKRYYLAPKLPFGWVDHPPSINRLLGLAWLTHILYPQQLSKDQYAVLTIQYFKHFYGYDLTLEELNRLSR